MFYNLNFDFSCFDLLLSLFLSLSSSYYYYHYCFYYFLIVINISYRYYSHHYYCSQYYQCYLFYFISFCFFLFILLWLLFCVACDMYVSLFFPSLVNDFHFIVALLIHVKNHFSLAIIVYIIIVIITTILFFSTLPVIGGEFSKWIRAAWSTPTHWLLCISRRVSLIFIFIYLFFVSYSLVTTIEVLTPSFIFII